VDEGEYVQPGTVIATLQQLDTMKADFTVPEQLMHQLHIGQAASFGLTEAAFAYQGSIIGIDPKIDPQTRLVSVRAEVRNPDGQLSPGQFIRVRVQLPAVEDVIALPQTAVVTSLYGDYVYVVEPADAATGGAAAGGDAAGGDAASGGTDSGGTSSGSTSSGGAASDNLVAKQVFVTTVHRQGNLIEIAKGLEPGQTVVTSGQNKLANNTPVTINNSVDPAELALDGTEAKP
jgi:membrane fusion protein (multidrug efflux system)